MSIQVSKPRQVKVKKLFTDDGLPVYSDNSGGGYYLHERTKYGALRSQHRSFEWDSEKNREFRRKAAEKVLGDACEWRDAGTQEMMAVSF